MSVSFLSFLGGIGLFLFGMETMTGALRELGRDRMRQWLARLTTTPLRGVATGLAATAVVQSSTAVTVMTIGFVGAGILSFAQSLGILLGANIGTTVTGWIVVMLGFKLKLGQIMLPVLFAASLMMVLGRGRGVRLGRMLAGVALLFLGLDMMQAAMADIDAARWLDRLPGDGPGGWLVLAAMGMVLVAITQSSSAGVAMALVLLGSGAIGMTQAAALVIGMNVGTTFTALLTAIGGSREVRMTGLANLLFNLVTAALALPLLGLLAPLLMRADPQTALVLFHSAFNILGALVFLPLIRPFAALIGWLVPDRSPALATQLDPRLLSDAAAAMDAADSVARRAARQQATALAAALTPGPDLRPLAATSGQIRQALTALATWLARIGVARDQPLLLARYRSLLHRIDHLTRLQDRLDDRESLATVQAHPALCRPARALAAAALAGQPERLARLAALTRRRAARLRQAALSGTPRDPAQIYLDSDAARWLARVADHLEGLARHAAAGHPLPPPQ
ncbi:MAG: Na/Pi cotransporter family protein [Paracoccus sp. (in: a-proteobacteria)]|uniref:Na/Pi cotransporter family protein n=1 Tax=Paracoccus sp. TaxID=267 RepID=UPI003918EBFF